MEKINFKNSKGLDLVGDFYDSDSDKVIIMCHGFTADRHETGRHGRIADGLNGAGYNVLNFDFSGSGESDDAPLSLGRQVDDLRCAIDYVNGKGFSRVGLFGQSLGGTVCLRNYSKDISGMVLTAPVTDKRENYGVNRFNGEQLKELRETGYITRIREGDQYFRKVIVIDKQMIVDRESLNQEELLSGVLCPVLIIHGDSDKVVSVEDSKNGMKYLGDNSRLEILDGEGHTFDNSLEKVVDLSVEWMDGVFDL